MNNIENINKQNENKNNVLVKTETNAKTYIHTENSINKFLLLKIFKQKLLSICF